MGKLLGWDYRIRREDGSHEELRPIFFIGFSKYRITIGFEPIFVLNIAYWEKGLMDKLKNQDREEISDTINKMFPMKEHPFTDEEIQAEIDKMNKEYEKGK